MKRLVIFFSLLTVPAWAQEPHSVEDVTNQCLVETGQLRMTLGQTLQALAAERKKNADLQAQLANGKRK